MDGILEAATSRCAKVLYNLRAVLYHVSEVIDMTLGENLQRLRRAKGLSQDEVARRLYLSRQSVSKWENDQAEPGVENLKALSRLYDVTVDELVGNAPETGTEDAGLQPDGMFQLAVMVRFLTALYGVFFVDGGLLLYSWDLPVLLAGFRFQNRFLWGTALASGGASLFVHLLLTARVLLTWDDYGFGFSSLVVAVGIAVMLALLLQEKAKSYFCSEDVPKG